MALMQIQSPPPGATVEGWIALCVGEATGVASLVAADVAVVVAPIVIGSCVFGGGGFTSWPDPASATAAVRPATTPGLWGFRTHRETHPCSRSPNVFLVGRIGGVRRDIIFGSTLVAATTRTGEPCISFSRSTTTKFEWWLVVCRYPRSRAVRVDRQTA
jgi:hypothetical protein